MIKPKNTKATGSKQSSPKTRSKDKRSGKRRRTTDGPSSSELESTDRVVTRTQKQARKDVEVEVLQEEEEEDEIEPEEVLGDNDDDKSMVSIFKHRNGELTI